MTVRSKTATVGVIAVVTAMAVVGAGSGIAARQARSVWDGIYTGEQARRGAPSTSSGAPSATART